MAFIALLWKARTVERYRLNYEQEKMNSIMIANAKMPNKTLLQKFRHYRYDTKKRLTKFFRRLCPEGSAVSNFFIYLKTDQTFPNFLMKSVVGFLAGIVMTYLCFMFFVFQLSISLVHATLMSCIIGVLLTLGLAFSYRVRCLVFLLIPQFFSKMGRYTLTCYALVLILTGPATNTLRNSEVLSESMACGQIAPNTIKRPVTSSLVLGPTTRNHSNTKEQLKSSVKQIAESIKKPFNSMKDTIKHMIGSVKQVAAKFKQSLLSIHRLVMSIVRVMESAFSWLSSIVNICNKKVGTPYERCTRALNDGVLDCRARLGPYFSWLCNVTYVAKAACYAVKPLDVICVLVQFMKGTVVATIKRKLRVFSNHVKTMLYVNVHIHHSYSFSSNASRSASQVAAGIVTEIRHRAEPLLTWLSLSSCVTSLFLLLIIFRAKYYQHMFETRSRFDNHYITKELRDLDLRRTRENRDTVLPLNTRERAKYVDAKSFRLVASEKLKLSRSIVYMMITTFKLLIHIVADYSLYWVLMTIRYHGRFQSPVLPGAPDAGIKVAGEGAVAGMIQSLIESLGTPLSAPVPSPVSCLPDPYPPDFRRYTQIGILILLLWFSVFFEPYGLRLRHVVMGHYRPERAKARAIWLYNHILRTKAGFLKLARRKLHRSYKYLSEEKFTFRQWLDANIPCWWLRYILGTGGKEAHCLLCGTTEHPNDPDRQLYRCETPNCPGIFCTRCFADIGQMCTICMSPIDYGDISDVSFEKGSSAESSSTESSGSDDDTNDDSSTDSCGKSRNSDADDSDSSPPKKEIVSYFEKKLYNDIINKNEIPNIRSHHREKNMFKLRDEEAQLKKRSLMSENIIGNDECKIFVEKNENKYEIKQNISKTKLKFWKTFKKKKYSIKGVKSSNFIRNRATFKHLMKRINLAPKIKKIIWQGRENYVKNISIGTGSISSKPLVSLRGRDSMLEIKQNILNLCDKICDTEPIMTNRKYFINKLISCARIRKVRRKTKTVPHKRIFLEKTSSTEVLEITKCQNTVAASDSNTFKLEHNAETNRANENLLAAAQKNDTSDLSVRKAMIVKEESSTIQKMLTAIINKNELQATEVQSPLKPDERTNDKFRFSKILRWSFWKKNLNNPITSNVSSEKDDSRLIKEEKDLTKTEMENHNQTDSVKKLTKMSSNSWIKAHYDKEVGIQKPKASTQSDDFIEIKEELMNASLKRKVKLKVCSKEDLKEVNTFEWRGKATTKICCCPATSCCCKGEHVEPSIDATGEILQKKKKSRNPSWLARILEYLHKDDAPLPAGSLLPTLQRTLDEAHELYRNTYEEECTDSTNTTGPEYCLSRCPQFFKSTYVDERKSRKRDPDEERTFTKLKRRVFSKVPRKKVRSVHSADSVDMESEIETEEEAEAEEEMKSEEGLKQGLELPHVAECDTEKSVNSQKYEENYDERERRRFLKLKTKIKLAKQKARTAKTEMRGKPVDEASFQDFQDGNFLSDGIHSTGPSQSRVSIEEETKKELAVEGRKKELPSSNLRENTSKNSIYFRKNVKLAKGRINASETREPTFRNPFIKYYHGTRLHSSPRKRYREGSFRVKEKIFQCLFKKLKRNSKNDDPEEGMKMLESDSRISHNKQLIELQMEENSRDSTQNSANGCSLSDDNVRLDFEHEKANTKVFRKRKGDLE